VVNLFSKNTPQLLGKIKMANGDFHDEISGEVLEWDAG